MKIKSGYVLRKVCGEAIVMAIGDAASFNGMLKLNNTAAFLWEHMQDDFTKNTLSSALIDEYKISEAEADCAVSEFIKTLSAAGVIET